MQRLQNPFPLFLDERGSLLDAGNIYIGAVGQDPEVAPLQVYWDAALSIPATQPLRTRGGLIVNNGAPSAVFINADDYSVRVRDADGSLVSYTPSTTDIGGGTGNSYQPLDDDLTAIAGLGTADFGRQLLTLANQAALKTAVGYVPGLATTGGSVSGDITRQGAGVYVYHNDPALTSGQIFVTAAGAADPTTQPGQIWLTY